ncbi:MAG: hypothetical protein ABW133_04865 [Polyangiaceae bacterium]
MRTRSTLLAASLFVGAPLLPAVAFAPKEAAAATAVELSMSELVGEATLVVAGTPLDSRSVWEGDASSHGRRIVTYTRVKVDRVVDGAPRAEVWIRTLGGEVGDIGQQVAGEAVLRTAQPSLLFLKERLDGTQVVVGMAQGQYLLEARAEAGGIRVRAPLEGGQHVVAKLQGSGAKAVSARSTLIGRTLDEVVQLVAVERRAHAR